MADVQFTLNVPCINSPNDIIMALSNKHNINRILLTPRPNQINDPDISIYIAIKPVDKPRFVIVDLHPILRNILYNDTFINSITPYDIFVKIYFKDTPLLLNKWLRYAQTIRGL